MRSNRLRFALLGILVCGLVAGSAALFLRLARRLYAERVLAQVWPKGTPPPVSAQPAASGGAPVLLLGDSRIAEWGLPRIRNARVLNAGAPGATSAQLASRCRELIAETHPRVIVVQLGINDLKLLGVRPELRSRVVSACVSNLLEIVEESRRQEVRVLLTLVWPPTRPIGWRRLVWSGQVEEGWTEVNHRLQELAVDHALVRVVDLFGELTRRLPPGARHKLYRDTLHLTPEAYRALTPLLEKALQPWLNGS